MATGTKKPKFGLKRETSDSGEIRKHYFLDRYVIIAPLRGKRPDAFAASQGHATETATSPAIEEEYPIYQVKDEKGRWLVRVIANKFPALTLKTPNAFGKQEMVIETPNHNEEFSQLSVSHIQAIFKAYVERQRVLRYIPGIAYVVIFKNDGPSAGATIAHAHSQIIALPMIPPVVETEALAFEQYRMHHESCPICDIISWEKDQKVRIMAEDKDTIAICPYAASAPFSLWIIPKKHKPSFADFTHDEYASIARILKSATQQLDRYGISFNFFLHESVPNQDHHFILKVEPRPNVWGGMELSTGVIINPVAPEYGAKWYQNSR